MANKKPFRVRDRETRQILDIYFPGQDVNVNTDGTFKALPEALGELQQEISEAGTGNYTKPPGGIPYSDLSQDVRDTLDEVADKVTQVPGKGLSTNDYTTEDKTKLAGLSNYNDAELRQQLTRLQTALNNLMNGESVTDAIDTFAEVTAFLNGINTDDDTLATQLLALDTAIKSVQQSLLDKANTADVARDYATKDELSQKANDNDVVKSVTINGQTQTPQDGNVSFDVQAGETVVINSDGANIIDGQSDSILTAPSSRMVKEIYLNLQKLFDPVNGLANIAFVGTRPTWQNVAIPAHTITLGTMSNVAASINGTAINGSASAPEGDVTILLTPSGNNYMGSISVKDASNNDVNFTQTDVAGGTEITFILSGNVTISASASSGIQVNVSGTGITSYTTGVQPNTAAQLTIALPEHHTWGTVTVSYGGTDITGQCTISPANNADKVITLPNNLSDMSKSISIVADTVEDAHVTLAISGSNFVVKQGSNTLTNGSKVYNGSAAQTLTIEPAGGYKFSTQPSADNGTMTNNGPYEASSLEIGTSVSGTLTITAAGAALETFSIDLLGLVGVTSSNLAESILEGSPYSTTLSKTDASAAGSVIIGTCTMGNEDITPPSGNTISVAHVTGHIVIAASVGVQPSIIHSYDMAIDTDANNKRYIADTGDMGSFPLYNSEDVGFDNETFGSGWYGNGSYTPNRNGGFVKYGNPALGLSAGDDFSVVLRDLFVYPKAQNINPAMTIGYNKDQVRIKFYPEREVNRNLDSEVGQFELSVWRNATSGAIGNGDYVQLNIKKWTLNTSYFGSSGKFPCTREKIAGTDTYTHTYHLMMTFVASTLKATAYLIDIDNVNNTVTVTNGGSLTMEANLKITGLGFKKMSELGGLDIYNYAVAENNIAGLFTNNN